MVIARLHSTDFASDPKATRMKSAVRDFVNFANSKLRKLGYFGNKQIIQELLTPRGYSFILPG